MAPGVLVRRAFSVRGEEADGRTGGKGACGPMGLQGRYSAVGGQQQTRKGGEAGTHSRSDSD